MGTVVKWMDDEGNEVAQEKATHAMVAEYDEEGNLIREDFGTVAAPDEK